MIIVGIHIAMISLVEGAKAKTPAIGNQTTTYKQTQKKKKKEEENIRYLHGSKIHLCDGQKRNNLLTYLIN